MKICLLLDQLVVGGVQKIVLKEAEYLNRMGHQVDLIILIGKGEIPTPFKRFEKLFPIQFINSENFLGKIRNIKIPGFSFLYIGHFLTHQLCKKAIKKDYDIIIAHGSTTCLSARKISQEKQIPYIAFIYDSLEYIYRKVYKEKTPTYLRPLISKIIYRIEKKYLLDADKIVTQSISSQKEIEEVYPVKTHIIIPGCEISKKPAERNPQYLLALSRWSLKKNPQKLLQIIQKTPTLKIKIAGNWENRRDREIFKKYIQQENLSERTELISDFDLKTEKELYRGAFAWIHPHLEGFGMGALQSASYGCPIIIPQNSGSSFLFDNRHGFFPKEKDLKAFQSAVEILTTDLKKNKQMGQAIWQQVQDKFSWEKHTKKILSLIQKKEIPTLTVLELGHVSSQAQSGGDILFKKIKDYLPKEIKLQIIIPQIALPFWSEITQPEQIKNIQTFSDIFSETKNPYKILINYFWRIYQSQKYLCQNEDKNRIIYSSTNSFPDILTAFHTKRKNHQMKWIARIHHLAPNPQKRGINLKNLVRYFLQKISLKKIQQKADLIIVLNKDTEKNLISMNFDPKKIIISGGGIDLQKYTPSKRKETNWTAIFVGRLHPEKGVFDLPLIWKKMISYQPQAKLAIVGETNDKIKERLIHQFQEQNISSKNYHIFGYLPEEEKIRLMQQSLCFIFTDHEAGWGLAIAEAMGCGLPIVGYNLPIFGDIYKKGYFTAPVKNYDQLAKQINKLIQFPEIRKKKEKESLEQALSFQWKNTAENLNQILQKRFNILPHSPTNN